jgi:hypothetical protein
MIAVCEVAIFAAAEVAVEYGRVIDTNASACRIGRCLDSIGIYTDCM